MSLKILCINTKPNFDFFTKRGLNLDVSYGVTYQKFEPIKVGVAIDANGNSVNTYSPDVFKYLDNLYKNEKYDAIFFGWKPEDYPSSFAYTGGQTFRQKLSNGAYFATTRQDGNNYEPHELMHIIGQILYIDLKKYDAVDQMDSIIKPDGTVLRYYKNDRPDDPDSNWAVTWETYKKYLPELNNLNKMPTYKYFKPSEIVGLKPELVEKLDKARDLAGVPFIIESGFRTPEHNKEVGGVENSAHTKGLAVDLRCNSSVNRFKIVFALLNVGFKRIGISYKRNFIHADIDTSLPQEVIWGYDN